MDLIVWVVAPLLIAAGSAFISYWMMRWRLEMAVAREQCAHTETRERLRWMEQSVQDKVALAEMHTARMSVDNLLLDLHVEGRRFIREHRNRLQVEHTLVRQERLFFREIPLSNWIEHEVPVSNARFDSECHTVFTNLPSSGTSVGQLKKNRLTRPVSERRATIELQPTIKHQD